MKPKHPTGRDAERLALAQQAFEQYRAQCFWYMQDHLVIGPEDIEWLVKGLRHHGGHQGFLLADKLCR